MRKILFITIMLVASLASAFDVTVQPFSGRLIISENDIFDNSESPLNSTFTRFYDSKGLFSSNGIGWRNTFDITLLRKEGDKSFILLLPDGQQHIFKKVTDKDTANEYTSASFFGKLIENRYTCTLNSQDGHSYTFDYDGVLQRIADNRGNTLNMFWFNDQLINVKDMYGRVLSFKYNDEGLMSSVSFTGEIVTYEYDKTGRLITVKQGEVEKEKYVYKDGKLLSIELGEGGWNFKWDKNWRVAELTSPTGYKQSFVYKTDKTSDTFTVINPENSVTSFNRMKDGKMISITYPDGGVEKNFYNKLGKTEKIIAPNGDVTSMKYDDAGRLLLTALPDGRKIEREYDNESGNLKEITYATGLNAEYEYNDHNELVEVDIDGKPKQTFVYDKYGRVSKSKVGDTITAITYTPSGAISSVSVDGKRVLDFKYDSSGNFKSVKMPDGESFDDEALSGVINSLKSIAPEYDLSDITKQIKSADGYVKYKVNKAGKLSKVIFPSGFEKSYEYSKNGSISKVASGDRVLSEYSFDIMGRHTAEKYANGKSVSFKYHKNGMIEFLKGSNGQTYKYVYDDMGRLEKIEFDGMVSVYKYEDDGRIESYELILPGESSGFMGSLFGTYVVKTDIKEKDSGSVYDLDIPEISASYNFSTGKLSSIYSKELGDFSFTKNRNSETAKYPNGVSEKIVYSDDSYSKVISLASGKKFEIKLSKGANDSLVNDINGSETSFSFDERGQLLKASGSENASYSYDKMGNRLSVKTANGEVANKYAPDGRLLKSGRNSYIWDESGNLTGIKDELGTTKLTYNDFGKLIKAETVTGKTIEYLYDDKGFMVCRKVNGRPQYFLYNGVNLVGVIGKTDPAEKKEEVLEAYLHADGVNKPIGMLRLEKVTDGNKVKYEYRKYYFHRDRLDNVVLVTNSSGGVAASYSYTPYGHAVLTSGDFKSSLLFGGQYFDRDLGLYYMKARFYDPSQGRFITPDPVKGSVRDSLSLNPYIYARNNPIIKNDPLGLSSEGLKDSLKPSPEKYSVLDDPYLYKAQEKIARQTGYDFLADTGVGVMIDGVQYVQVKAAARSMTKLIPELVELDTESFIKVTKGYTGSVREASSKAADKMGKVWTTGKFVVGLVDGAVKYKNGAKSGEDFIAEDVVAEGIGTGLELYAGSVGSTFLAGTSALSLPAVGYIAVTNWSINNVKAAMKEGWAMYKAAREADQLEEGQKNNDLFLVERQLQNINDLINKGDIDSLKRAQHLADGLSDFTSKRMFDDPRLINLDSFAYDLHDQISDSITDYYKKKTIAFNEAMAERERIMEERRKRQEELDRQRNREPRPPVKTPTFVKEQPEKIINAYKDIERDKQLKHKEMSNLINFIVFQEKLRIQRNRQQFLMALQILALTVSESAKIYQVYQNANHQSDMSFNTWRSDYKSATNRFWQHQNFSRFDQETAALERQHNARMNSINSNYANQLQQRQDIFKQKLNDISKGYGK